MREGLAFRQLAGGQVSTCGFTTDGDVYCWGYGDSGILGQDDNGWANSLVPPKVAAGGVKFAHGYDHGCAIVALGETCCWKGNEMGELGVDKTSYVDDSGQTYDPGCCDVPERVAQAYTFSQTAPNHVHTCGYTLDKQLLCWEGNSSGQLGNGNKFHLPSLVLANPLP